ncbi:hypothetical protein GCM10010185_12970 [Saccharothrix coeruleofusca]|uniref:Uncharacterized protein n=1 Tax=Saccharothrix coeruleofusca TaxID=33919 RepID=A0A918EBR0_9PSEU|nr:hypothetical protein GCM10010185_12970 [Saccharothrix coeruleofusca]
MRAERSRPEGFPASGHLPGLSHRTTLAVRDVERRSEEYYVRPGATALALRRYRVFLTRSGRRPLYPRSVGCSCAECAFQDVRHSRDVLEWTLERLRRRSRGELERLVTALDAVYLKRTLPDPFAARRPPSSQLRGPRPDPWWYDRLSEPPGW